MTVHHAAFWLDHNELRALALDADGTGHRVLALVHAHDVHTHSKKLDGHRHPIDARFIAAIEDVVSQCDAIALSDLRSERTSSSPTWRRRSHHCAPASLRSVRSIASRTQSWPRSGAKRSAERTVCTASTFG